MTSKTMIKSAGTIEQKGVAQLLQIEEVRLNSTRRCGLSQSPHAQKLVFLLSSTQFKTHLLGSICCMQTFLYLEEASRQCQSHL